MTNPRYDEQFRRGYSGPPVQPPVDAGASTSQADAPQPLQDDGPGRRAPAGEDRVVDESSGVPSPDVDGLGSDIASARPFRRNPFAIALLAAGVLMLIVGVWLVEQSTKLAATSEQQAVSELELQLTGPLLTGGVIAIVTWLVLGAVAATTHRRGA